MIQKRRGATNSPFQKLPWQQCAECTVVGTQSLEACWEVATVKLSCSKLGGGGRSRENMCSLIKFTSDQADTSHQNYYQQPESSYRYKTDKQGTGK